MTVTTLNIQAGPYTANGSTTVFPFDFAAFSMSEIRVVRRNGAVDTPIGGWTVQFSHPGGTVTFATAPTAGSPIYILSVPSFLQQLDFANQGDFSASSMNEGFDRSAIRDLTLLDGVNRNATGLATEVAARSLTDQNLNNEIVARTTGDQALMAAISNPAPISVALNAATRALLAGLDTALGIPAILTEGNIGGVFQLGDYASYTALVTADTTQAVFVRSVTNTAKVWIRQQFLNTYLLNLKWFGAKGDAAANDYPAMAAALAFGAAMNQFSGAYSYVGSIPSIYVPFGHYKFFTNTVTPTYCVRIFGENAGMPGGWTSWIEWSDGVSGFNLQAPGCTVEGFGLSGGFTAAESNSHAVTGSRTFAARNLFIEKWGGNGINIDTNAGGNLNGTIVEDIYGENVKNLIFSDGPDSNACKISGLNGKACRQLGLYGSDFLGNAVFAAEFAACGITSYNDGINIAATVVSYLGNRYFVLAGQETWCSTHAPTGTTLDNQGWGYSSAGGAQSGIPAWFSGILCRIGGSFFTDNINGRTVLVGCYSEGGQGLIQIAQTALIFGGISASSVWRGSAGVSIEGTNDGMRINRSLDVKAYSGGDEVLDVYYGESSATHKTWMKFVASTTAPAGWFWRLNGLNLQLDYAFSTAVMTVTGPNTTDQLNSGSAQPHYLFLPRVALPSSIGGAISTAKRICRAFTPTITFTAPSGGTVVDAEARTAIGQLNTNVTNIYNNLKAAGLID